MQGVYPRLVRFIPHRTLSERHYDGELMYKTQCLHILQQVGEVEDVLAYIESFIMTMIH